jgi:hypothetical protein
MGQRIVFEYYGRTDHDRANWSRVTKVLSDCGGDLISEPSWEPRMLVRASLPNEQRARVAVDRLRTIDSVGRISLEALRTAY